MTNDLKFTPEFLGRISAFSAFATIVGIWAYHQFFKDMKFTTLFFWSSVIATALGLSNLLLVTKYNRVLGLPDQLFCLGDTIILSVVSQINFLPILVLTCRLCPKNIEGTMFALVMSTLNLGGTISMQLGSLLTLYYGVTENDFTNLY